jgi:hypothetical protein
MQFTSENLLEFFEIYGFLEKALKKLRIFFMFNQRYTVRQWFMQEEKIKMIEYSILPHFLWRRISKIAEAFTTLLS